MNRQLLEILLAGILLLVGAAGNAAEVPAEVAAAMEAAGCPPDAIAREPTGDGVAEAFEAAFGPAALC